MTLGQMSAVYREDERVFDERIALLRGRLRGETCEEERTALRRRIVTLRLLRRQSTELAELTERYYERGYRRDARYTL